MKVCYKQRYHVEFEINLFSRNFFQESANTSGVKDNGPQTLVHAISAPSSVTDDLVPHRLRKKAKHLSDLSDDSEDSELLATQQLPHHLSIRYTVWKFQDFSVTQNLREINF